MNYIQILQGVNELIPWYTCKVKNLALCPNQGCGYLHGKMYLCTHWKSNIDKLNSSGSAKNGILCEKQVNTIMDVVLQRVHIENIKKIQIWWSWCWECNTLGEFFLIPCLVCHWALVSPQVNRAHFPAFRYCRCLRCLRCLRLCITTREPWVPRLLLSTDCFMVSILRMYSNTKTAS